MGSLPDEVGGGERYLCIALNARTLALGVLVVFLLYQALDRQPSGVER